MLYLVNEERGEVVNCEWSRLITGQLSVISYHTKVLVVLLAAMRWLNWASYWGLYPVACLELWNFSYDLFVLVNTTQFFSLLNSPSLYLWKGKGKERKGNKRKESELNLKGNFDWKSLHLDMILERQNSYRWRISFTRDETQTEVFGTTGCFTSTDTSNNVSICKLLGFIT